MLLIIGASDVTTFVGGALGGALLTGAFALFRDYRTDRHKSEAAKRVLEGEITDAIYLSCTSLERGKWPIAVTPLWNESWRTYRESVASVISGEEFAKLEAAYRYLNQLENVLKDQEKYDQPLDGSNEGGISRDRVFLLRGTASCAVPNDERSRLLEAGGMETGSTGVLDRAREILSAHNRGGRFFRQRR